MKEKKPYTISNRRLVCKNLRFNIFFDDLNYGRGQGVSDYLIVSPKQRIDDMVTGVAVLPILKDRRYALLKIFRHAVGGYSWEVPRGFIEPEEGCIEAAVRELEEETSLRCEGKDIIPLGCITPDAGILSSRIRLFAALSCSESSLYAINELGHMELGFFDEKEIFKMANASLIQDPSTLISLYRFMSIPHASLKSGSL